jgi:acyl-CoA thioesterase
MHIEEILATAYAGTYHPIRGNWGQGRTIYGGMSAAILCAVAHRGVASDRVLKQLDVTFLRPMLADTEYDVVLETLADGKTLTVQEVRLIQEDKVRVKATANFLKPLTSEVYVDTFIAPQMADRAQGFHFNTDLLPAFVQHFDNYATTKGIPFSGTQTDQLGGWMRYQTPPTMLTPALLVGLIDAWPPTAAPNYQGFKPLSTIGWSIHFANPLTDTDPAEHLGYLAKVNHAADGLSSSKAQIWNQQGQLLATSYQTNIIYG